MSESTTDARGRKLRAFIDAEHFRFRRFDDGAPAADEIAIESGDAVPF